MNREIKFRAWDKNNQKIREVVHINFDNELFNVQLRVPTKIAPKHWILCKFDQVVLQQFTGFYDMNGVEIYEGDIIECKYADTVEESGFGLVRNEIRFCEGAFCWIGETSGKPERLEEFDCKSSVVAGNIYENPELLK